MKIRRLSPFNAASALRKGLTFLWSASNPAPYDAVSKLFGNPAAGTGTVASGFGTPGRIATFNGSNYIDFGTPLPSKDLGKTGGTGGMTLFFYARPTASGCFAQRNDSNAVDAGWSFQVDGSNSVGFCHEYVSGNLRIGSSAGPSEPFGKWTTFAVTIVTGATSAAGPWATYSGGRLVDSGTSGGVGTSGSDAARNLYIGKAGQIGGTGGSATGFVGDMALVALFNRALTANEIAALHQDPFALMRTESETLLTGPIDSYYVNVTVASGKVGSDLTDFPVMVNLADMPSGFWSHVTSDGRDIRATTLGGTSLPCDLAAFNYGAHTGTLWVKSSLLAASSNGIRITYGNSSLSAPAVGSTYGRNAVWSDYKGVFALGDTTVTDRTGIGNATTGGSPTYSSTMALTGGGSADSAGTSSTHVSAGSRASSSTFTLGVTASFAAKVSNRTALSYWNSAVDNERAVLAYRPASSSLAMWDDVNGWLVPSSPVDPTLNQPYRMHAVYSSGTNRKMYINGAVANTQTSITARGASYETLRMLAEDNSFSEMVQGSVGFVYLRHSALSADWIAAEYSNLNAPSSFYSTSSEAPLAGSSSFAATSQAQRTAATGSISGGGPTQAGSLDVAYLGAPFNDLNASTDQSSGTLDRAYLGQPFVPTGVLGTNGGSTFQAQRTTGTGSVSSFPNEAATKIVSYAVIAPPTTLEAVTKITGYAVLWAPTVVVDKAVGYAIIGGSTVPNVVVDKAVGYVIHGDAPTVVADKLLGYAILTDIHTVSPIRPVVFIMT